MKILAAAFLLSLVAGSYGQVVDGTAFLNQTVLYGNDVQMTCTVTGSSALSPLVFRKLFSDGTWTDLSSNTVTLNTTKYSITNLYTLNIAAGVFTDDGGYQCAIDTLGFSFTSYLIVADLPANTYVYWGNYSQDTPVGQAANLTCETTLSRPAATFRWFNGSTEITTGITNVANTVDANGYATAMSYLLMTPTADDAGSNYTCMVDLGDLQGADAKSLVVSLSAAGNVLASVSLVFVAVFAALRM